MKVLGWIKRGELRAINVADKQGKRPRWRISPEELQDFLRSRTSSPTIKAKPRSRVKYVSRYNANGSERKLKPGEIIDFYASWK
jgi:hypothetical protein